MGARVVAVGLVIGALAWATPARADHDRGRVTPAGFAVAPAGREIGVSQLAKGFQGPLGAALSPDGRYLLAASSGAARIDSADLFDLRAGLRSDAVYYDAQVAPGQAAFYGVAYAPDGRTAWVAGGGQQVVHVVSLDGGHATEQKEIAVPGFAAGLAYGVTPAGPRVYVALNTVPPFGANTPGHQVAAIDPATNTVEKLIELTTVAQPLGVAFSRDGRKAFVSNWLGRSVDVIDTASESKTAEVMLDPDPLKADHPSALAANPRRDEVYVANANSTRSPYSTPGRTRSRPRSRSASSPTVPRARRPTGSRSHPTDARSTWRSRARTRSPWWTSAGAPWWATSRPPGIPPTSTSAPTAAGSW